MIRTGALAAALLLGACTSDQTLPITEVLNHRNCQFVEPGLSLVTIDQLAAIRGSKLIGVETDEEAPPPEVALVVISKGAQPTPGYAFRLTSVRSLGGRLALELEWEEPAEDAVLAQMMTHPCVVVGIDATGYDSMTASDQHGVLGSVDF